MRKQWTQELFDKFGLPSSILEAKGYRDAVKQGHKRPFEIDNKVVVTSYEFGAQKADDLAKTDWDLVIFDEAHRLRNVYRKGLSKRATALRDALKNRFKLLLTATPLQNSLMELYGLVSFIDDQTFGDQKSFREQFANSPDLKTELLNAIMGALDAHTAMSTQALNSVPVQNGMKDILLNHAGLWETLRAQSAAV